MYTICMDSMRYLPIFYIFGCFGSSNIMLSVRYKEFGGVF